MGSLRICTTQCTWVFRAAGRSDRRREARYRTGPVFGAHVQRVGCRLEWSGRSDEAEEQERKAISIDPFFAQPHLVLDSVYERLGKYDEAIVEHLESDALEGIDPSTVDGFKRTYMRPGINGYRRKKLQ
jgi:tetratricopeptide (TPR) repeat protein